MEIIREITMWLQSMGLILLGIAFGVFCIIGLGILIIDLFGKRKKNG